MNKNEIKNKNKIAEEFHQMGKDVRQSNQNMMEQNKKILEVDHKLDLVNAKMDSTNKYINGFESMWGFLPNLFSKTKKAKDKTEKKEEGQKVIGAGRKSDGKDTLDELEAEIEELRINSIRLNEGVSLSLVGTDKINNKINITTTRVDELERRAKGVKQELSDDE